MNDDDSDSVVPNQPVETTVPVESILSQTPDLGPRQKEPA